ncbi:hypothetical protein BRC83_04950 [Halobacteriales archaeon QS_1_68_17]|nr:MAG: hypothetical protein BRC83_04950 [Halobacteriales archaeon QS_1_68_17]
MTLYEREYGTDWDALDRDEATARAFALGVAATVGQSDREELEAIYAEMETSYERSIVELAYEEGKQKAHDSRRRSDAGGTDAESVWEDLVVVDDVPDRDESDADPTGPGPASLPPALSIADLLDRHEAELSQTNLPEFLER